MMLNLLKIIDRKIMPMIPALISIASFCVKAQPCADLRYIKVNIHFMLKSNGTGNYNEYHNGKTPADSTRNGFWYAQSFIDNSNDHFANNQPMNLPAGNTTPNPETKIRVVLSGVYFHRDDRNYFYTLSNRSSGKLNEAYGINKNSELNIFIQHDTVSRYFGGIACGLGYQHGSCVNPWIKLAGIWLDTLSATGATPEQMGGTLNHEIGHVLGLGHTFSQERNATGKVCSDTPRNKSVWCGETNNVMDYNCWQSAITPCQLEIMQNSLDTYYKKFVLCCSAYPLAAPVYIGSQRGNHQKIILDGSWRTNKSETGYAIEIIKTDTSGSRKNFGHCYSQTFSGQYRLIELSQFYNFTPGIFYKIKLTVTGDNCNLSDSEESWIKIENSNAENSILWIIEKWIWKQKVEKERRREKKEDRIK